MCQPEDVHVAEKVMLALGLKFLFEPYRLLDSYSVRNAQQISNIPAARRHRCDQSQLRAHH